PVPPPVAPIIRAAWTEALGDRTREADYRAFFIGETRRLGIDAVIRTYLPAMVNGLAGSATHPLMRLAYVVLKKDDQEVGTALGYWAACYLLLPSATGAAPDTDDPGKILADVGTIEGKAVDNGAEARKCGDGADIMPEQIGFRLIISD
ncbi:questin oxidase family protein, partial [Rhizobium ruizarguesonis]